MDTRLLGCHHPDLVPPQKPPSGLLLLPYILQVTCNFAPVKCFRSHVLLPQQLTHYHYNIHLIWFLFRIVIRLCFSTLLTISFCVNTCPHHDVVFLSCLGLLAPSSGPLWTLTATRPATNWLCWNPTPLTTSRCSLSVSASCIRPTRSSPSGHQRDVSITRSSYGRLVFC